MTVTGRADDGQRAPGPQHVFIFAVLSGVCWSRNFLNNQSIQ